MRGVAGDQHAAGAEVLGDQRVEPVDRAAHDVGVVEGAEAPAGGARARAPRGRRDARRRGAGTRTGTPTAPDDDHPRALGVAVVHRVALVVGVVDRVDDQPALLERRAAHGLLADRPAHEAAPAVGSDQELGVHHVAPAGSLDLGRHARRVLGQRDQPRAVAHLDVREAVEPVEEHLLELGVIHRVLHRMAVARALGAARVREHLAARAEELRPRARQRHGLRRLEQAQALHEPHRLVVDADRARQLGHARVLLDEQHVDAAKPERVGGGEPGRAAADDQHLGAVSGHPRPPRRRRRGGRRPRPRAAAAGATRAPGPRG